LCWCFSVLIFPRIENPDVSKFTRLFLVWVCVRGIPMSVQSLPSRSQSFSKLRLYFHCFICASKCGSGFKAVRQQPPQVLRPFFCLKTSAPGLNCYLGVSTFLCFFPPPFSLFFSLPPLARALLCRFLFFSVYGHCGGTFGVGSLNLSRN